MSIISDNVCALSYTSDAPKNREEAHAIAELMELVKDIIDYSGEEEITPIARMDYSFDITDRIDKLKNLRYSVFAATEIMIIKGGEDFPDSDFPVLHLKIINDTEKPE